MFTERAIERAAAPPIRAAAMFSTHNEKRGQNLFVDPHVSAVSSTVTVLMPQCGASEAQFCRGVLLST